MQRPPASKRDHKDPTFKTPSHSIRRNPSNFSSETVFNHEQAAQFLRRQAIDRIKVRNGRIFTETKVNPMLQLKLPQLRTDLHHFDSRINGQADRLSHLSEQPEDEKAIEGFRDTL